MSPDAWPALRARFGPGAQVPDHSRGRPRGHLPPPV